MPCRFNQRPIRNLIAFPCGNFAIFWDIAPRSQYVDRRFGRNFHLYLQGRKSAEQENIVQQIASLPYSADFPTLRMEVMLLRNVCSHRTTQRMAAYCKLRDTLGKGSVLCPVCVPILCWKHSLALADGHVFRHNMHLERRQEMGRCSKEPRSCRLPCSTVTVDVGPDSAFCSST
jgi:hypothetical protein